MKHPSMTLQVAQRQQPRSWLADVDIVTIVLWGVGSAVGIVGLVFAAQSAMNGAPFPDHGYRHVTLLVWAAVVPMPLIAWATFQDHRSIWVARLAPSAAARAVERTFRRTLAISLAVGFLPQALMLLLAPPPGGRAAGVLLAAGLIGGTFAWGAVGAAAWRGQLSPWWVLPGLVGTAMVPVALAPADQWTAWQSAEGWRAWVLVALAASPLLSFWILWPHTRSHAVIQTDEGLQGSALRTRVFHVVRRLTERIRYVDGTSALGLTSGIWGQLPQQLVTGNPEGLVFMPWGSDFTTAGPYRLLLFTLFASLMLLTPALHWRHLLAPRGAVRAHLGWRIWLTTYLMVSGWLALTLIPIGLGVLLLSNYGLQVWPQVPGLVLRYVPVLLLDLALATALAALIRGWAGTLGRALAVVCGLVLAWGVVHLLVYAVTGQGTLALLRRDANYVLLTLTAAISCGWGSARTWSRADLGELLRSSQRRGRLCEDNWN